MKIAHVLADTPAEAIRAVAYVRAWTIRELARQIKASETHLSAVVCGHSRGSEGLRLRVLAHMPEGVIVREPPGAVE